MAPNKNHIKNIEQLEKEIFRLQYRARKIEDRIDGNIEFLQDNFLIMARNTLFPKKSGSGITALINLFLEHDGIRSTIKNLFTRFKDKTA